LQTPKPILFLFKPKVNQLNRIRISFVPLPCFSHSGGFSAPHHILRGTLLSFAAREDVVCGHRCPFDTRSQQTLYSCHFRQSICKESLQFAKEFCNLQRLFAICKDSLQFAKSLCNLQRFFAKMQISFAICKDSLQNGSLISLRPCATVLRLFD